ncbi:MAG: DUF4956 domain-containing protein [Verrucomicrobia bacterium]|nr:DUF4956 domain-containing protein [Verrucomicrobiota bacterium]
MNFDWITQGEFGSGPSNWPLMILGLLLAFACGHVISWVYMMTHSGLSYSRSFVNSLVLLPPIVALVMMVLVNNLITAFGMMAVFAIVRFRNILRDTLDTTYILISLVIGMATGTYKFASAVVGCALVSMTLLYLWYAHFGTRHRYDLIVSMLWTRPGTEKPELERVLRRHSITKLMPSERSGEEGTLLSYRLLLRDVNRSDELKEELEQVPGVSRVNVMHAEDESEL